MNGLKTISRCINCGSEKIALQQSVVSAPFLGVQWCGGFVKVAAVSDYWQCHECKLFMQNPRMTDERIDTYYREGIYRKTLNVSQADIDKDSAEKATELAEWVRKKIGQVASHLDIGCGRGDLLREVGAGRACGFDPHEGYSRADGASQWAANAPYQLVSIVHVLEHVTDPKSMIAMCKSLAARWLLVEVPGEHCPSGWMRFPHLYCFPPATLIEMLGDVKIRHVETTPHTRILCEVS